MSKIAHNIEITVFAKPEENVDLIKQGLIALIPFDLEQEKIILKEQTAISFDERKIKIFSIILKKESQTNKFIDFLRENLTEHAKQTIKTQLNSRIDEEFYFYLRFDKEIWINERKLFLVDHGNCYHVKMSLAVFPKKIENAVKILEGVLTTH